MGEWKIYPVKGQKYNIVGGAPTACKNCGQGIPKPKIPQSILKWYGRVKGRREIGYEQRRKWVNGNKGAETYTAGD